MTELLQELTEALDAWKAVSPAVGQLREMKDFRLPDEEWTSAMRAVILVMPKLQALGKGELEEKLAQASGDMSELYAGYRVKARYWWRHASFARRTGSSARPASGSRREARATCHRTYRCAGGTVNCTHCGAT